MPPALHCYFLCPVGWELSLLGLSAAVRLRNARRLSQFPSSVVLGVCSDCLFEGELSRRILWSSSGGLPGGSAGFMQCCRDSWPPGTFSHLHAGSPSARVDPGFWVVSLTRTLASRALVELPVLLRTCSISQWWSPLWESSVRVTSLSLIPSLSYGCFSLVVILSAVKALQIKSNKLDLTQVETPSVIAMSLNKYISGSTQRHRHHNMVFMLN